MDIKLKSLTLENFKGIRSFTFAPEGKDAIIRGENATGKTTIADGFRWLLFDKDSQDHKDFAIKTILPTGEEPSGLDHTVTGTILIDGHPLQLRKIYREKWTKKRGEAQRTLTGHTTEYFVDGVPTQLKQWQAGMEKIISEETFKLLTLPTYFNSLHWTKRREILLQVCGDIQDADVIASTPDLAVLPEILGQRSFEDHRKVISAQRKTINDRLREIPARIDELTKSLPQPINRQAVQATIDLLTGRIKSLSEDTFGMALRQALSAKKLELSEFLRGQAEALRAATAEIDSKIDALRQQIRVFREQGRDTLSEIESSKRIIARNEGLMIDLRAQYKERAAQESQEATICPTCGQHLPETQLYAARAKFRELQATDLAKINQYGKDLRAEADLHRRQIADLEAKMPALDANIKELEQKIERCSGTSGAKIDQNPAMENLQQEITILEKQIQIRPTNDINIKQLEIERQTEQAKLAAQDAAEKSKERIEILKKEEKDLAKKFEELERQLFLIEKFEMSKARLLENQVAGKFELARFKLFEIQINEGIRPTCVTTVNGVPYGAGLNKGMEINVGLDIIRTLSEHYQTWAPVWVDNSEAITHPLEIKSQTFKLIVDENYKKMEVQYAE